MCRSLAAVEESTDHWLQQREERSLKIIGYSREREEKCANHWLQLEGRSLQIIGCSRGVCRSMAVVEGGEESADHWLQQREGRSLQVTCCSRGK